jgi:hypothetical protein
MFIHTSQLNTTARGSDILMEDGGLTAVVDELHAVPLVAVLTQSRLLDTAMFDDDLQTVKQYPHISTYTSGKDVNDNNAQHVTTKMPQMPKMPTSK